MFARSFLIKSIVVFGNLYFSLTLKKGLDIKKVKKILVIQQGGIGDVVSSIPVYEVLKKKTNARVDTLVGEWSAEILEGNPYIDNIIRVENETFFSKNIFRWLPIISEIRKERYDMAIILDLFFKPFLAYLCKIPIRAGIDQHGEGFALTLKYKQRISPPQHYSKIYSGILSKVGFVWHGKPKIYVNGARKKTKIVGIAPGGGKNPGAETKVKIWPLKKFAKLGDILIKKYKMKILLFGDKNDLEIAKKIKGLMKSRVEDLTGKTSIREAASLIRQCNLFIANDSALMHISAAVGTPTVAIFGPTNPKKLAPEGVKYAWHADINYFDLNKLDEYNYEQGIGGIKVEEVLNLCKKAIRNKK